MRHFNGKVAFSVRKGADCFAVQLGEDSYALGQGAPMVAAIWGVFIWKEFKGSDKKVNLLLGAMFLFFIAGLGFIIASGN